MDDDKKKKIILITLASVVVVALLLIGLLLIMSSLENQKRNIIIDSIVVTKWDDTIVQADEAGNIYVSIEAFAPLLSYEFYNGEYNKGTEDRTKCYVKNQYELVTFEMDSNFIYKLSLEKGDGLYNKYIQTQAVKRINDRLYVTLQTLNRAFNVVASFDTDKEAIIINTLPGLVSHYDTQVKNLGYTSLASQFDNQKSILSGLLVVIKDGNYGVINTNGDTVIGTKYENITFIENTVEFMVESNQKKGVLTKEANQKIGITYDDIKVIDTDTGLYLVKSNERYGILKKDGNVLLYVQYENIGIPNISSFPNDDIKNPYVIHNGIPVRQDNKWGIYSLTGEILLPIRFAGFGCIVSTSSSEAYKNVLLIPESEGAEGIVVESKNSSNLSTYGIASIPGKRLLTPATFSKIYRDIVNGEISYYMIYGGQISTVRERITANFSEVPSGTDNPVVEIIGGTTTNTISNSIPGTTDNTIANTITNSISNTIPGTIDNTISNTMSNTASDIASGVGTNGNTVETSGNTVTQTPTTDNVVTVDPNSTTPVTIQ